METTAAGVNTVEAAAQPPESLGTEDTKKLKVMVAIDDSDESFYALQWVLEKLIQEPNNNNNSSLMLTIMHVIDPFPHYIYPGVQSKFAVLNKFTGTSPEFQLVMRYYFFHTPGFELFPAVFPTTSIILSVNKAQKEDASAILTQAINMCAQKKVKAKTSIFEGDPKDVICDVAEQICVDLIVIGSRGLGKIKRAFLGSVSDHVIHHAKCPVLVIKPATK